MSAGWTRVDRAEAAGFRLLKFELYNWGTFHGRIWTIPTDGNNCLITGEIGSGKSTLVDAVTTLLVPPHRAAYNRAAGAEVKERGLRSYVEGYYKSERYEDSRARPVSLRGVGDYSVILGCFGCRATGFLVTLAQVFWMRPGEAQPERFYAIADRELSIAEHFTNFGDDPANLRRALKESGVGVPPDFKRYRAQFMRLLGIQGEQALNLFHQTVSMKSVGNLTEFVRRHMLSPFDAQTRIANLISHFDDLTKAHESIKIARRQIELLSPIVKNCGDYAELCAKSAELAACIEAVYTYFAGIRKGILEKKGNSLFAEAVRLKDRGEELKKLREEAAEKVAQLARDFSDNGGNRIALLEQSIAEKRKEMAVRRKKYDDYAQKAGSLGLSRVDDRNSFARNMEELARLSRASEEERGANDGALQAARIEVHGVVSELAVLREEIASIRASRSNIDRRQIAIRAALAAALGVREDSLPFVGELLRVRPEERDWEGAAERILHGFGLSLLVPDERYGDVSDWVERNHLNGRLVYYRVRELFGASGTSGASGRLSGHSLVRKIEIKPDSPFFDWLFEQLSSRFDYACCDDMPSFRRERRAVTRAGQVKYNEERHEKDDRSRIDDRSHYILGWDNRQKLDLLEGRERVLRAAEEKLSAQIAALEKGAYDLRDRQNQIAALAVFSDYDEVDWRTSALESERMEAERAAFIAASGKLAELKARHDEAVRALQEIEGERDLAIRDIGANAERRAANDAALARADELLTPEDMERHRPVFEALDAYCRELFDPAAATLEVLDAQQPRILKLLTGRKDAKAQEAKRLSSRTELSMASFRNEFPLETQEFDAAMESAREYGGMLMRLERDDLPRFEERFKELLNRNAIVEIANFHLQLRKEADDIKERIRTINRSLSSIDYNDGRYIKLEAHEDSRPEIRQFQMDLRACTDDTFNAPDDDAYSERKFRSVCEIVERLKGRPEHSDADRRWTALVTDVRNWFTFSASERWKETDEEHEHYTDSGGKSGGQKEKLAYTVLAAGLAYQFGLEAASARAKTFRFVMIDEAFGKGSDESARFALSLFRTLGLQLLIITPKQKHRAIEPYVSSVAFVHIKDDKYSSFKHMSIEEYVARREEVLGADASGLDKA